jgi:dUTPase
MDVRFVRLHKEAKPPIYCSHAAAGADLFSVENYIVPAKGVKIRIQ